MSRRGPEPSAGDGWETGSSSVSIQHINGEITAALIGVAGGLVTGAAGAVWGPIVKDRFERRRKATELRDRYSTPLLQAAFDLQSRLYNIVRQNFLQAYLGANDELRRYAECSTLWLLSQYLGWTEILRREVQFLDFGTTKRNRALQEALGKVSGELATDARGRTFAVFRTAQRAIGELMIVESDGEEGSKRSVCLGYARFVSRLDDPTFANWFETLREDLNLISRERAYDRLIRAQRALVDVVDQLDPERVRYPVLDNRGKLPLSSPEPGESEFDSFERLARFVARASEYGASSDFPGKILTAWAMKHSLEQLHSTDASRWSYGCKTGPLSARVVFYVVFREQRMEIYGAAIPPNWAGVLRVARPNLTLESGGWRFPRSRRRGRIIANDLLDRFSRPQLR